MQVQIKPFVLCDVPSEGKCWLVKLDASLDHTGVGLMRYA